MWRVVRPDGKLSDWKPNTSNLSDMVNKARAKDACEVMASTARARRLTARQRGLQRFWHFLCPPVGEGEPI